MIQLGLQLVFFPIRFLVYLYFKIRYFLTKPKILFIKIPTQFSLYERGSFIRFFREPEVDYFDFLIFLKKVAEEKKIEKIILYIPSLESLYWNQVEDTLVLLEKIKKSGKEIHSYVEEGGLKSLLIASVGTFRYSSDWSQFVVVLPFYEQFYLKNFLKTIGIEVEVFAAGKYKSAGEMYSRNRISKFAKENYKELLENRRQFILELFLRQENLSKDLVKKLWELFKNQSIISSKELLELGFFTDTIDLVQLKEFVSNGGTKTIETNIYHPVKGLGDTIQENKTKKEIKSILEYENFLKLAKKREFLLFPYVNKAVPIALLVMDGVIVLGEEEEEPKTDKIHARAFSKVIQELQESKEKAVIIYLNSPGGMSDASEILYQEIKKLSRIKPVYVFQGSVAASGGYYISCAANKIFANHFTITGSIGVLRLRPNFVKLYRKYKIHKEKFLFDKTTEIFSESSILKKESRKLLKNSAIYIYNAFLDRVAKGRGTTIEFVKKFAEGRVYTSLAFKKNQLIDHVGSFLDIFEEIKKDLKISDLQRIKIYRYPHIKFGIEDLIAFRKTFRKFHAFSLMDYFKILNKDLYFSLEGLLFFIENKKFL
ncbi:MAG: signal peptide peptidase SppA [Leptonema sp. (in: bacteria)]